jgi:hypothetical protein
MGWAYGENENGRKIGYAVKAKCDFKGCKTTIDRGLAYVCGVMHGDHEEGCGDYFCEKHRAKHLHNCPRHNDYGEDE